MAKKIFLQYRGNTPRPFNVGGLSGVLQPHGNPLPFPQEIADQMRKIFPECVVVGSEDVKDITPVEEPVEDEVDTEYLEDDLEEEEADAPQRPTFPLDIPDDEDVPNESWTVREIREWFDAYDLMPKQNLSKAKLLRLVKKAVNG